MDIQGLRAVVVGGASGMARATATLLAEQGAKIVLFDLPSSEGKAVADELGGVFLPVGDDRHVEGVRKRYGFRGRLNVCGGLCALLKLCVLDVDVSCVCFFKIGVNANFVTAHMVVCH